MEEKYTTPDGSIMTRDEIISEYGEEQFQSFISDGQAVLFEDDEVVDTEEKYTTPDGSVMTRNEIISEYGEEQFQSFISDGQAVLFEDEEVVSIDGDTDTQTERLNQDKELLNSDITPQEGVGTITEDVKYDEKETGGTFDITSYGERGDIEYDENATPFERSLAFVNRDLFTRDEEPVVNRLNYHFNDYGFSFEESGVLDNVTVTAPNKSKEDFAIDSWFMADNKEESRALRDFLRKNQDISIMDKMSKEYDKSKKKYFTAESYKEDIKEIQSSSADLVKRQKEYFERKEAHESGMQRFINAPQELYDDPKFNQQYQEEIAEGKYLATQAKELSSEYNLFKNNSRDVDVAIGNYVKMKEQDGTAVGTALAGIYNNLVGYFDSAISTVGGTGIDMFYGLMQGIEGNDYGLSDEEYKDEFIRVYEGYKGITVPQDVKESTEAFSNWAEGLKQQEESTEDNRFELESIGSPEDLKGNILTGRYIEEKNDSRLSKLPNGVYDIDRGVRYDYESAGVLGLGQPSIRRDKPKVWSIEEDNWVDAPPVFGTKNTFEEIDNLVADQQVKKTKKGFKDKSRDFFQDIIGVQNVSEERVQAQKDDSIIMTGLYGAAESIPALLPMVYQAIKQKKIPQVPSGKGGTALKRTGQAIKNWATDGYRQSSAVAMALLHADKLNEQMEMNPEFEWVSETEKKGIVLPLAITSGILETIGFRNLLKGTSGTQIISSITAKALSSLPKGATPQMFRKAVINLMDNRMTSAIGKSGMYRFGQKVIPAALGEAETGALQEIADIEGKNIYNAIKGKEMFKNPDRWSEEYFKQIAHAAAAEAVGGFALSTPMGIANSVLKDGSSVEITNEMVALFDKIKNDEIFVEGYKAKIDLEVSQGLISKRQGEEKLSQFNTLRAASTDTDKASDLSGTQKKDALQLIFKKRKLESEMEGMDSDLGTYKSKEKQLVDIKLQLGELGRQDASNKAKLKKEKDSIPSQDTEKKSSLELNEEVEDNAIVIEDPSESFNFEYESESDIPSELQGIKPVGRVEERNNRFSKIKKIRLTFTGQQLLDAGLGKLKVETEAKTEEEIRERNEQEDIEVFFDNSIDTNEIVTPNISRNKGKSPSNVNANMQTTVIRNAKKAAKAINKLFPKVRIVIHDNSELFTKQTGKNGRGYFNPVSNTIHVNMETATKSTPYHEALHAMANKLVNSDKAARKVFGNMLVKLDKVLPNEGDLKDRVDKFIKKYETEEKNEEAVSELLGILAAEYKTLTKPTQNKVLKLINAFLKRLNIPSPFTEELSKSEEAVVDFFNTVAVKLRQGEDITEGDVQIIKDLDTDQEQEGEGEVEILTRRGKEYKLFNDPNPETAEISSNYKKNKGINTSAGDNITTLDIGNSMKIADAYENMKDNPEDLEVQEAYNDLAEETIDQYKAMTDNGYEIEIYEGKGEPYANSKEMIDDLKNNKHIYIFSTASGYGNEGITDTQRKENPMLKDSGFKDNNGKPLLTNDLFRAVHDFFGHSERGNGFGAKGEENAWDVHARMFTDKARRAMTSETRGQNSWVNFGPQMRNESGKLIKKGEPGYLIPKERSFAPQKIGLLPIEFSNIIKEDAPQSRKQMPDGKPPRRSKFVPIEQINSISRGRLNKSVDSFNALKESIAKDGIKEALVLQYNNKENKVVLMEGHHRLEAANQLGITYVPIKVIVNWDGDFNPQGSGVFGSRKPKKKLDVSSYKEMNYFPTLIDPSEIGLTPIESSNIVKESRKGKEQKPIEEFTRETGMDVNGFYSAETDMIYLQKELNKIAPGYKVKQEKINQYGQGGEVYVLEPNGGILKPITQRRGKSQNLDELNSAMQIVIDGRIEGFPDKGLKFYMKKRGFKAKEINEALKLDKDLFLQFPKSFANVEGGLNKGVILLNEINDYHKKLLDANKGKRKNKRSLEDIVNETIEFMYTLSSYKNEGGKGSRKTSQQQAMEVDILNYLSPEVSSTNAIRILNLNKNIRNIKWSQAESKRLQRKLRQYIRSVIPRNLYGKGEVISLIDKVNAVDKDNFKVIVEEVTDKATEITNKYLGNNILDVLNKSYTKVQSGRLKGTSVSNDIRRRINDIQKNIIGYITGSKGKKGTIKLPKDLTSEEVVAQNQKLLDQIKALEKEELTINGVNTTVNRTLTPEEAKAVADLGMAIAFNNTLVMKQNNANKTNAYQQILFSLKQLQSQGMTGLQLQLLKDATMYMNNSIGMLKEMGVNINPEQELKNEGKKNITQADVLARYKKLKDKAVKDAGRGKVNPISVKKRLALGIKENIKAVERYVFGSAEDLAGLMDRISLSTGDLFGGFAQELVSNEIRKATRLYKGRMLNHELGFSMKMTELFGKKWTRENRKNSQQTETIVISNVKQEIIDNEIDRINSDTKMSSGEKVELLRALDKESKTNGVMISQNELLYYRNQALDPSLEGSFKSTFEPTIFSGQLSYLNKNYDNKNEYTSRIENEIVEKLDSKLIDLGDWMVNEFFPAQYEHYNKTYNEVYRSDMPWNKYYAGRLYRKSENNIVGIDLLADGNTSWINNVSAASAKFRQENSSPIRQTNAIDALLNYTRDMEYFAAYAVPIRNINKVFQDPAVKEVIADKFGNKINDYISSQIEKIANKGARNQMGNELVNFFNTTFLLSRLGLNPTLILKQLTSSVTYGNDIGYVNWAKYATMTPAQWKLYSREILDNSIVLKDRYGQPITRIVETYQDKSFKELNSQNKIIQKVFNKDTQTQYVNTLMTFTMLGDKGAILLGGIPNYRFYKDKYLSENANATEQDAIDYAIVRFEDDTLRTQQSSDLQDKDYFQTKGPFFRAFNMFLTTPKQYLRREIIASRNLYRKIKSGSKQGKGGYWENVRTLLVYHVVMPTLFRYVSMGSPGLLRNKRDEDDQELAIALIMGNLNALFIIGDLLNVFKDTATGKYWADTPSSIPVLEQAAAMSRFWTEMNDTVDPIKKKEYETKFYLELTTAVGIPGPQLRRMLKNYTALANGEQKDMGDLMLRLFNFSEYVREGEKVKTAQPKASSLTNTEMKKYMPDEYREMMRAKQEYEIDFADDIKEQEEYEKEYQKEYEEALEEYFYNQ